MKVSSKRPAAKEIAGAYTSRLDFLGERGTRQKGLLLRCGRNTGCSLGTTSWPVFVGEPLDAGEDHPDIAKSLAINSLGGCGNLLQLDCDRDRG
ncbi:hypothetical protein NL676_010202 [Syzygium grande]|nr:hypothetical protein NL676_010202 [Syzygium grande]